MDQLLAINDLEEMIDVGILSQMFPCGRMLYSKKLQACKNCMKKKKGKKKNQKNRTCEFCGDTGKLPYRIHKYLGQFNDTGQIIDEDYQDHFEKTHTEILNASTQIHVGDISNTIALYDAKRSQGKEMEETEIVVRSLSRSMSKSEAENNILEQLEQYRSTIVPDELNTVTYLKKHGLEKIDSLQIKARSHSVYPNLIELSYSSISSNMEEDIVQECRGLILDRSNDWGVVAFPYKKFFNYGDPRSAPLDWASITLTEKVDGSIAIMYYYNHDWHIASSSTPDGSKVFVGDKTFSEVFWKVWQDIDYSLPHDENCTYVFEIILKDYPIVVKHERDFIYCHGARDNISFQELDSGLISAAHGWKNVPTYIFESLETTIEVMNSLNPLEHEGFVATDSQFNRCKLKSKQYVSISLLNISNSKEISARHILDIIRMNETFEFLAYFPEFTDTYLTLSEKYETLINNLISLKRNNVEPSDNKRLQDLLHHLSAPDRSHIKKELRTYNLDKLHKLVTHQ
eukprot:TRINITY_DN9795_c0_g1_i1.p1 TRINITY_DN9795_c0_g1~~TRINITY_DN9795_c0_g1_i1.p1  ORF type:complete len:514 (+),score=77.52 TRINITY_DN9795_c0_g1_i1:278-1819(+)